MPEYHRTTPRTASERVYRALLRVYPRDFRDEFGDAMVEFHRDRLAHARREGTLGVARVWARVLADVARNAVPARLDSLRRRIRRHTDERDALRETPSLTRFQREDFMLASILQDIRYALRTMRRAPGFTLTVLATLALGIGASVATFSAVNGVLLKPLPFRDPASLVRLDHLSPFGTVSEGEFVDYRRELKSFEKLAAYNTATVLLAPDGADAEPERLQALIVTEDFTRTLGARVLLGRPFTADEERRGGPPVVMITHGLWMRRFGGDSSAVGKRITINDRARTVVGVLAPRSEFPSGDVSIWFPKRLNYDTLWSRNNHYLTVIGRLAPGATAAQATAQVRALAQRFTRDFPEVYPQNTPLEARVAPLANLTVAEVRPYLLTLFGAVLFVLLIACVNVANLFLARGEARRKEVAIRSAMGASGVRVVRQALTESLLYAVTGGLAGVALAAVGVQALRTLLPSNVPRVDEIAVNPGVLLFALGVTLATGLLFGMMPAMRSARHDSADTLKQGGKSSSAGQLGYVRRALVVSEIALSVVTLAGAGLMLRSLANLYAIPLGFRPENVLAVSVVPPVSYTPERAIALYRGLAEQARAMPGVVNAAAVEDLPITDGESGWSILIDGAPMTSVAQSPAAMPQKVTPGYFDVMRIGLVRGRVFQPTDHGQAPLVAVVNETMARTMWAGKDAIGGTVKMLNATAPWATVVGVVRDVRSAGFLGKVPPTMYFPQEQAGRSAYYVPNTMWLVVRASGDPAALAPRMRAIIRKVEPLAAIARVQTMEQAVSASVSSRHFATALIAGFAGVALVLAGIGIFGVISYSVNQRRFEIGLRLALGATPARVIQQVVGEGVRTATLGAVIGIGAALGATRLLTAMFVDVKPTDPLTLGSVTALVVLVALAASFVPARRASAVDPLAAIRDQ
jgi:putative ABC transport system permease protein